YLSFRILLRHLTRSTLFPYTTLFRSGVDSFKLLVEINKQAAKNNRVIDCLLQIHIATEDTKFGLDEGELDQILNSHELRELTNRSEEHTSELQSRENIVCRLLLEKKK